MNTLVNINMTVYTEDTRNSDQLPNDLEAMQAMGMCASEIVKAFKIASDRDRKKLGKVLHQAMEYDKRKGYGNTEATTRVLAIIEKVKKLNPKAFTTKGLIDDIIVRLWLVYADIEANGLDNAHYQVTDLPCNEYGVISDKYPDSGFINTPYKRSEES